MKTEHTPAPWTISETFGAIDGEDDISIEHEGFPLATVRGTNDMSCMEDDEIPETNRMVIANARLIAAAPKLLEALEKFTLLNPEHYKDLAGFIMNAKEAIKEATGSTHNTVNK
jgi:hypothetical protein